MSANIARINGETAMAYQCDSPWHKLGNYRESMTSVAAALDAAKLSGWNLRLVDLFTGHPEVITVPDARGVVRGIDGQYLATVGKGFAILQNEEAFAPLQTVCDKFGVTIETAGALGKGERVWMLAKMRETIEPAPDDKVNGYILITMGHDGTLALLAKLTPIRVVCQNTLGQALQDKGSDLFRFVHTLSIVERAKAAEDLITGMVKNFEETGKTFASMAAKHLTPDEIAAYITSVIPNPGNSAKIEDRRRTIAELVFTGAGADLAGAMSDSATVWGAYNAVVEYFDHGRTGEAKSESAKHAANISAVFGQNAAIKAEALTAARALVAV